MLVEPVLVELVPVELVLIELVVELVLVGRDFGNADQDRWTSLGEYDERVSWKLHCQQCQREEKF